MCSTGHCTKLPAVYFSLNSNPFILLNIWCTYSGIRTYCNTIQGKLSTLYINPLNIYHVGTPPDENRVLSTPVIPLFGILCPGASEDEECYFFMGKDEMKSPCCGHPAHTECFKTSGISCWFECTVKHHIRMRKYAFCAYKKKE